jgi:DNA-binding NarL/FixJ family response regulator
MHKLKVLLADDHDSFRRILIAFLRTQKDIEVVGEAVDGQEAIEQAERYHPDLVLMDIHMPKQNGIEATKAIKNRWPSTRVFILSMDPSEFYRRNTQDFADGFIAKTSMKSSLLSILSSEQHSHMQPMVASAYAA